MTTLLALDPGGTTGYSLWWYDAITPLRPIEHGQTPDGVEGFIHWWNTQDTHLWDEIVSERFVLDGRTARPDTTPLKIEGVLMVERPDVIFQPNGFKAAVPDAVLKRLGFWWKGQQHARDSARHALAYLKARGHRPTMRAYFAPRAA